MFPEIYLKYTSYLDYQSMFEAQIQQGKMLTDVYKFHGAMAWWL